MNTKNLTLSTLLTFFITLEVLIAINYTIKQQQLRAVTNSVHNAILTLHDQIGYTGLIHNLKNYVLRPSQVHYKTDAQQNQKIAMSMIGIIELEAKKLGLEIKMPETKKMLDSYSERLETITQLIAKDYSAREIDAVIIYNDKPSHEEIKATSDIIFKAINQKLSETLENNLLFGLITLIALGITLIALVRFFFKEQQLALEQSGKLNATLNNHKDELLQSQKVILSIINDVQQEKNNTNKLNLQLSKKNEEMMQFIYIVSHDLKSPLVTIGGFAKMLARELKNQLSEKQTHRLKRIQENVVKMDNLLTDLLMLSRVVHEEASKKQIDMKTLIEEQWQSLEVAVNESKATIHIQEPLGFLYANERLVSQCFLNLISNAIHYREPDRAMTLDISRIDTESEVIFSVKDNGCGIDSKYHEKIFNIFERLSKKTGSGVGLSIVKSAMEKHNGKVLLESTPGVGSNFLLCFPRDSHQTTLEPS